MKRTPKESIEPFLGITVPGFRDAAPNQPNSHVITVLNCLQGLEHAMKLKWYDPDKFDLTLYKYYKKFENGYLTWIIPGKFVASKTPDVHPGGCCSSLGDACVTIDEKRFHPVEFYLPIFQKLGIKHIIRLNEPKYDKTKFIEAGIELTDLYFEDCTPPPNVTISRKSLELFSR